MGEDESEEDGMTRRYRPHRRLIDAEARETIRRIPRQWNPALHGNGVMTPGTRIRWTDSSGHAHEGIVTEPPPVPEMTAGHVYVLETVTTEIPNWVRLDSCEAVDD